MPYLSPLIRWLKLKRYQYEVTFSLYMLTPTEKIIFNTLALLFISMILIAAFFYLPGHVAEMLKRAWFYYAGDETGSTAVTGPGPAIPVVGGSDGVGDKERGVARGKRAKMDGQDVLDMLGTL